MGKWFHEWVEIDDIRICRECGKIQSITSDGYLTVNVERIYQSIMSWKCEVKKYKKKAKLLPKSHTVGRKMMRAEMQRYQSYIDKATKILEGE